MATDHTAEQTFVAQVIQTSRFAIPLTGCVDESQVARMLITKKTTLNRRREPFRVCRSDKPATDDGHAIFDQQAGLVSSTQQR